MKNIYSFLVLLFCWDGVAAQQLYPTTISSGGRGISNGGILLEDNVGGLVVSTISTATFMYTQGFLQPDAGSTTVVPHIQDVVLSSGSGLDNAGTTFINGSTMLEFTVGEMASITHSSANNMLTQGILQPFSIGVVLPVTGLEFYARRLNSTTVQLDWKTIQEINNKGFYIERRKENESNFTVVGYAASNTSDGNSTLPLNYVKIDANNFTGNTYYRLRQEDKDGRSNYSETRIVRGDGNNQTTIQAWPVPASGPVNVLISGLTQPDMLLVIDMSGKLVRKLNVQNNSQVQLTNLIPGTYILRLTAGGNQIQKIIIQ